MSAGKLGGRPKGAKNLISGPAKENIAAVFIRLGGTAAMADWARENLTQFYQIYAKLIPTEVSGPNGGPMQVIWPLPKTSLDL